MIKRGGAKSVPLSTTQGRPASGDPRGSTGVGEMGVVEFCEGGGGGGGGEGGPPRGGGGGDGGRLRKVEGVGGDGEGVSSA